MPPEASERLAAARFRAGGHLGYTYLGKSKKTNSNEKNDADSRNSLSKLSWNPVLLSDLVKKTVGVQLQRPRGNWGSIYPAGVQHLLFDNTAFVYRCLPVTGLFEI